ncbi:MAG: hypothetical protein H6765_09660 [Candidatus Peribacteria bacterium]|nr:MAG: hypothetical protein H6765_09660 [Candidatus Peribacteria bacterium]
MTTEFSSSLVRTSVPTSRFDRKDVFDLQFPHYRKFINVANSREKGDGAVIAGTYVRYFVDDQTHIKYDQFLTWLWEMSSDEDSCNTYLRLKDQHIKYIVIDPNIGTVVQGAGNQTLFDRFFAKVDNTNDTILDHGVFTMLAKLYDDGYLKYVSSNNL